MFEHRIDQLCGRMQESDIGVALITDEDSVYYFTGYYDYLHMEFGRPTILAVWQDGETLLITPTIDYNSAKDLARVDRIEPWNDGVGLEWREHLPTILQHQQRIGIESQLMPALVKTCIDALATGACQIDVGELIADIRMIKSAEELQLARHAGEVATAMMQAGRQAIAHGVAEFEVALATAEAGTRTASQLLNNFYDAKTMSPATHFLQIMASGPDITRTHHRASNRVMSRGEPVFLCFCGMTNFHRFKLGFDRTFWIGEITEPSQEEIYRVAVDSQAAALSVLKPGVLAEDVHAAYADVIQSAGYDFPFRCGRGTGFSFLEKPQLVFGDKTRLQAGMVLAIDGSVSTPDFRAQVGDSVILIDGGYELLTAHPKSTAEVIIN